MGDIERQFWESIQEAVKALRAYEREEVNKLTDKELVAYWNIMQMGKRMVGGRNNPHLPIVNEILTERSIPHVDGKLIKAANNG